jgi:transposase
MPPEERLAFHQAHSEPLMTGLKEWMEKQFAERKVEPNSGQGKAIRYMQNHWSKLTLFLREAGAPLDSNIVERTLKKAILHRKNSLFFKTENGAGVGDLFMSLIYTCELHGVNAFDYLSNHTAATRRRAVPQPAGVHALELSGGAAGHECPTECLAGTRGGVNHCGA